MQGEGALAIGTQVSAKYKGAFCEAKVRSVDKQVKCRVTFKLGLGSTTISDKDIRTDKPLVQGATVLAKHPDKQDYFEAIVKEIKDQSRYTVTFNDGDIATLRRNALCMKSGKHYNASESLDNLPLTHPEHFSTPVSGSRRRSGRGGPGGMGTPGSSTGGGPDSDDYDSSSDGEEISSSYLTNIGRVVWAENTDKKSKGKETWFPALIVAPSASDTVKIDTKEEFLIRSFKDGRYYTVSKKDTNRFHKESAKRSDKDHLRDVIDKAVAYLERDELPPHWDKEILFNMGEESTTESSESEEIDDEDDAESPEEKDHLVAELYKHMEDRGAPINRTPMIDGREVDLYRLFRIVYKLGGQARVTNKNMWQQVAKKLGFETAWCINQVRVHYKRYLQSFEQLNRTLGCTMRNRQSQPTSGGRAQIRGLHRSGGSKEALSPATSSLGTSGSICGDLGESEKTDDKSEMNIISTPVVSTSSASSTPIITLTSTLTPSAVLSDTPVRMKNDSTALKLSKSENPLKSSKSETSLKSKLDVAVKAKTEVTLKSKVETEKVKTKLETGNAKTKPESTLKSKAAAAAADAGLKPKTETPVSKTTKVEQTPKLKVEQTPKSKVEQTPKLKVEQTNKSKVEQTPKSKVEQTIKSKIEQTLKLKSEQTPKLKGELKTKAEKEKEKEKKDKEEEKPKEMPAKTDPEDSPTKAREGRSKVKINKSIDKKDRLTTRGKSEPTETPSAEAIPKTPASKKKSAAVAASKDKEASSVSSSSSSSEKETKMTTRPRRDSTSSLAAAIQNKEKKDTIGESNKRPFVRVDRDRDVEKEAKKLQAKTSTPASTTATTITATTVLTTAADTTEKTITSSLISQNPPSPPNVAAPTSSRDSSNDRDSSVDKREGSRGRKKSGSGKIRQKIAKRDPAEDESMNGEEKQHLAPNVDVGVGDKIKVHYKRDTIYDAKVIKVQTESGEKWPKYFVHYQGWNARYDEWIKRSRIADNLSWNKERAKKGNHVTQNSVMPQSDTPSEPVSETQEPEVTLPTVQQDLSKAKETPTKLAKKEKIPAKQKGKMLAGPNSGKSSDVQNNSRSATPSSITSKESRTGSPVLKRQTSRTSIKKEETESEEEEEEEEEVAEPRKSSRLQKTPTSEKKKTQGGRKRPPVSKTESSETDVEVEHDDVKEETAPVIVLAIETPTKETPTKGKRGRKVPTSVSKSEVEEEKTVEPPKMETPRASRGTPTRERTPLIKTPKGRKGRGSSIGRDDEEDPYAFKEPEPFEEVKFETPKKFSGKKSATKMTDAEKPASGKKSGRTVTKIDSEESADSSSDEAGKKLLMARGRSRQKLILNTEVLPAAKMEVKEDLLVEKSSATISTTTTTVTPPPADVEEKKVAEEPALEVPIAVVEITEKVEMKEEPGKVESVGNINVPETIQQPEVGSIPEIDEKAKEIVKKEEPFIVEEEVAKVVAAAEVSNVPDHSRPVLQLSKKQQELFPHLAAIRTTSIPFSRNSSSIAATAKVAAKITTPPNRSPPHQQPEVVVEKMEELPKEIVNVEPTRNEEKTMKGRSSSLPPATSTSSSSPASSVASLSIASSKKQRKTPKKPNSSELVESDSDSGAECEKKLAKSSKSDSIKLKPTKGGRNWNSHKRKEPEPDSGDDEPLGLRASNVAKKVLSEKSDSKRTKTISATSASVSVATATVKKDDVDDLDLVCAETIPGSPVHPSSGTGSVSLSLTSSTEVTSSLIGDVISTSASRLEMPFASVPESIASPTPEIKVSNSPHPVISLSSPVTSQPVQAKEETTDEEEAATPATTSTTTTNASSASQSPREEVVEPCKSPAESSEVDLDSLSEQQKTESLDIESSDTTLLAKPRLVATTSVKRKAPPSDVGSRSPMQCGKRKRRTREVVVGRGRGGRGRHGSDRFIKGDDDFDEGDDHHHKNIANMPSLGALDNDALAALAQRSPNSKKYNFFVDLDPSMDSSERISRIQNSLKELRKTYHSVKSELAVIERRRKKIRRKERERSEKALPGNPVEAAA